MEPILPIPAEAPQADIAPAPAPESDVHPSEAP